MTYTDKSEINEKIGSFCVIQRMSKAIKRFLGVRTHSTLYMEELQDRQDSFSYTLSQDQSSGFRIIIDSQQALQALKSFNRCFDLQII